MTSKRYYVLKSPDEATADNTDNFTRDPPVSWMVMDREIDDAVLWAPAQAKAREMADKLNNGEITLEDYI